jgi:F-box protein 21
MSIHQVPDEVIQHLLYFISPTDNLASIQPLCYRLNRLANEHLLWRHHCRASFRYWQPEHDFHRKLSLRASEVDWKSLFILRQRCNAKASRLLEDILATKLGRVRKMEQLCMLGYDVKDFLLDQRQTPDAAQDVLSRRCVVPV